MLSYNIAADKTGEVSFVKCNLCSGWKSKHNCVIIPSYLWDDIDFNIDSKVVDYYEIVPCVHGMQGYFLTNSHSFGKPVKVTLSFRLYAQKKTRRTEKVQLNFTLVV